MNDLRAQLAEIWRDLKAWTAAHPLWTLMGCTVLVLLVMYGCSHR